MKNLVNTYLVSVNVLKVAFAGRLSGSVELTKKQHTIRYINYIIFKFEENCKIDLKSILNMNVNCKMF